MNKTEVAVCDADDVYRERFVSYLIEHRSGDFEVYAFSAPETFLEQLERQRPDAVIIGGGFAEVEAVVKNRGIPFVRLQENKKAEAVGETDDIGEHQAHCASVFRYQPVETILHEMWVLTGGRERDMPPDTAVLGRLEVIGIYSPMRHEMQMPFSLVLSEILAERRKVLYVNFMEHSGFRELFGLPGGSDLGDIFIRLQNHRLSPEAFRRSVYGEDGMCFIPPFQNPEDLRELSWASCEEFLDFLEKQTDFDTIILDFGMGLNNFAGVLRRCSSVYCPTKSGFFYECQQRDFMDYLDQMSNGQMGERIHMVPLPFTAKQIHGGGDVRRQLLWSEFGDYVRGYMAGNHR